MKKHKVLDYFRLIRPQGAASTSIAILIGYLIMGGSPTLINLFVLFIIGILGHIFGFVLNEYIDIKVDQKSSYLKEKPLVSGAIPKSHALFIALFSIVSVYGLLVIFFFSLASIVFLTLALLCSVIYDTMGKNIPGSDLLVGAAGFFICMLGGSTVSFNFTNLIYIVSLSIFIFLVFCNAIIGGLEDADHDHLAGAKTTATRMGVKIENGKFFVTKKFKLFSYALELAFILLIVLASIQPEINLFQSSQYEILIVMLILITIMIFSAYKFLNLTDFDRPTLYRLYALNGVASYSLVPIILLPITGLIIMLFLLILPTLWLLICNMVLFGNPLLSKV